MKTLQSLFFYLYMFGFMVVMGLIGLPLLLAPRSWARAWLRVYLSLLWLGMRLIYGVTFEVRGRENLPEGGALIASKHINE